MSETFLSGYELEFLLDVALSLLAGLIVGLERETRGKDAGISTHSLVITGTMVYTFLSSKADPMSQSRIAAQVVTGIGFLGAGLILKEGATVRNLTTAASVWFSGSIGMCFGFGYHSIGLIATVVSALVPRIPNFRPRKAPQENGRGEE